MQALSSGGQTAIKFNQGHTLLHLAGMYPTLLEVILELVQNALDKDVEATRIWITINYKTRFLAVRDNGKGASATKFNSALASVAEPGRKGEGSLGQFGIGLVSPLGKCDRFVFISCPAPHMSGFQEWTFDTQQIVQQKENLAIPVRVRHDLTLEEHPPRGKTRMPWRSEMSLIGFTTDEFISRVPIDALIGGIQDRYAATMRRIKTVISVEITDKNGKIERRQNVTAPDFHGRPLPEQTLVNDDSGGTTFRLFVSPKTSKGRRGRVLMGVKGSDFRFPFHLFSRSATSLLAEEVINALSSGLFEGEILSEKVRLHATRKTFDKDDAFIGLCCSIEEWFDQFGSKYLADLKKSRQEQRFQELGLRSLQVLERLLQDPAHAPLLAVLHSFGGSVTANGTGSGKARSEYGQNTLSTSSSNGASSGGSHQGSSGGGGHGPAGPTRENPRPPLSVAGPKGQSQKSVKRSGFGLQFAHEAMEGSPDLWKLNIAEGVLTFNIRHPLWIACDEKDVTVMKLQECVVMQALTLQMMPEQLRVAQRQVLDELTHSLVSWILNGDRARKSSGDSAHNES